MRRSLLALLSLSLMACSSGYESTITYSITLKSSDISGTSVADDNHINSDDSQWKAFLGSARSELGEDAREFEVTKARLQLDVARAKNVGKLEDVLTGEGALFLRAENGAQVDIATFEDLKGTAQLEVDLTGKDLKDVNASLASSNFRVGLRSSTSKTRDSDFDAPITVTLDVTAR
ncbi:hypothetical protein P2318_01735 [Myxococcaceae bacterium GXIMD 01537]